MVELHKLLCQKAVVGINNILLGLVGYCVKKSLVEGGDFFRLIVEIIGCAVVIAQQILRGFRFVGGRLRCDIQSWAQWSKWGGARHDSLHGDVTPASAFNNVGIRT